jgi:Restriction endonuclease XhoI
MRMLDLTALLSEAVREFWQIRDDQQARQGVKTGRKDTGNRAAVTGGRHAAGFVTLIEEIVKSAGLPTSVFGTKQSSSRALPGFFRPAKSWDVVVVHDVHLVAAIEIKTQVGSFGNNYNNRVEEAIGSAIDLRTVYDSARLGKSRKPWLGYFLLLEDAPGSVQEHTWKRLDVFEVDPLFQNKSYAERYALTCKRLVEQGLYDATCFIISDHVRGQTGYYRELTSDSGITQFADALSAHVATFVD